MLQLYLYTANYTADIAPALFELEKYFLPIP